MEFDASTLSAGLWYYDGGDTFYFRGDVLEDTVRLPDGKAAQGVKPRRRYRSNLKDRTIVKFDRAIPNGELMTIYLRDTE